MIKTFFKYYLTLCIILSSTLVSLHAHTEYEGVLLETRIALNSIHGSNPFVHACFTSDSENNQSHLVFTITEKDSKDDEADLQDSKDCSVIVNFKLDYLFIKSKDIINELPSYSYFEDTFKCWYILYRVFRI